MKDKEQLKQVKSYALSNSDIKEILPNVKIFTYPDLNNVLNIDELFRPNENGIDIAIMLYLTVSENIGHWIGLIKKGSVIEMYDAYGSSPERLKDTLNVSNPLLLQKQPKDLLRKVAKQSGYVLKHNAKAVQPINNTDVATCGRHIVMRLIFADKDNKTYNRTIGGIAKQNKVSVDDLATALSYDTLHK